MNKKKFIWGTVLLFLMYMVIFVLGFLNPFSQTSRNKRSFEKSISSLSEDVNEIELNDLTSFEWDVLYNFSGYSSTEYIDDILGFKSHVKPTYQEGRRHMIFVKNDKIVCRLINGDNEKYYFELPFFGEPYTSINSNSSIVLKTRREWRLILTAESDWE